VYQRIGDNLPLLLQYEALFQSDPRIGKILVFIYKDILEFHRRALRYFQQPSMSLGSPLYPNISLLKILVWKQLYNATWKTYKARFSDLIENMSQNRSLIERQANLSEIEAARNAREESEAHMRTLNETQDHIRRQAVYQWLRAANVETDQHHFSGIRAEYPQTGKWLLALENFRHWFDPLFPSIPPMLWLNGKPGSGRISRHVYELDG
jgi:hypothetical protein